METTTSKLPISKLLLPRAALSQCVLGAFVRDTRGCDLQRDQRFNHFSAVPFCAVSIFFEGAARQVANTQHLETPEQAPLFEHPSFSGPQTRPQTSWNDADIYGMIIVFYPEAIAAMCGLNISDFLDRTIDLNAAELDKLRALLAPAIQARNAEAAFENLQDALEPEWAAARAGRYGFALDVADWSQSLLMHAAMSRPGRSLRQSQRRIKRWIGQPLRRIQGFAKTDKAFALALNERKHGQIDIAGVASDAGFSDQSHMGRTVRAQTGFTPSELMRRINSDEAFWSFRLMGERY